MVTTIKHNFSELGNFDNPMIGLLVFVNNTLDHLWAYGVLFLIFVVASWVLIRRSNDIGKSFVQSTFIVALLTMLLFYLGKSIGVVIVSEVFTLTLFVALCFSLAGIIFMRHSKNQ